MVLLVAVAMLVQPSMDAALSILVPGMARRLRLEPPVVKISVEQKSTSFQFLAWAAGTDGSNLPNLKQGDLDNG
jgi:hypothetical protein